jgi:hypothetical protein
VSEAVSQVISEILNGDSLTLTQAAKLVPAHRGEGRSTTSRLSRWVSNGQKDANGRSVKLEAAKFGVQVLTSKAALERFLTALNSPAGDAPAQPRKRTTTERQQAAAAAVSRLSKAGA